jgi:hypothetical protein
MKTTKSIRISSTVKTVFSKWILSFVIISLLLVSCREDENVDPSISEDEAAEVVAQAVSGSSGGETGQIESAARIAEDVKTCGIQKDSSISKQNQSGAAITYLINLSWNYKLTCAPNSVFQSSFTGNTTYDAPRMSSNDQSTGTFTISDFGNSSTSYTYNSSYTREGSQVSKIRNKRTFTSKTVVTSSNIKIDKTTLKILSGEAAVTIIGSASTGEGFSYSGTITFNGNQKAILKFQNGSSYNISW